jgi:PAS domain-containing protein
MDQPMPRDSDLSAFLDAFPSMVLLTDDDVMILDANRAAREALGLEPGQPLPRQAPGDLLGCIFPRDSRGACGRTELCPPCVVRNSIAAAAARRPAPRRVAHMVLESGGTSADRWFQVSATPLTLDGRGLVLLVLDDVTQLVELRQMLPLCPGCLAPRAEGDPVSQARVFLREHPGFLLADELCDRCLEMPPEAAPEGTD